MAGSSSTQMAAASSSSTHEVSASSASSSDSPEVSKSCYLPFTWLTTAQIPVDDFTPPYQLPPPAAACVACSQLVWDGEKIDIGFYCDCNGAKKDGKGCLNCLIAGRQCVMVCIFSAVVAAVANHIYFSFSDARRLALCLRVSPEELCKVV